MNLQPFLLKVTIVRVQISKPKADGRQRGNLAGKLRSALLRPHHLQYNIPMTAARTAATAACGLIQATRAAEKTIPQEKRTTMLGYVIPEKAELKLREYEIYTGYYCGICKYIGKTYGQVPRMVLSYDAAFIALMLASVDPEPDAPVPEHCVMHHIRHKTVIRNRAIEYAGDLMLILAWFKLIDDAQDEGKLPAKAGLTFFRRTYRKLQKKYPALCRGIDEDLAALNELERNGCDSIDRVAEGFARVMQVIFEEGLAFQAGTPGPSSRGPDTGASETSETTGAEESPEPSAHLHETFAKIGYHLGKWIYLIDAADDIEENLEAGTYNPLLLRFRYNKDEETPEQFRERIDERLRFNLFSYLAVIGESLEELDIRKNSAIINNVIYFGLNRRTEEVLKRIQPEKRRLARI